MDTTFQFLTEFAQAQCADAGNDFWGWGRPEASAQMVAAADQTTTKLTPISEYLLTFAQPC